MAIQQRSQIKGFGQSTNEKYLVLDVNDVVTKLNSIPDVIEWGDIDGDLSNQTDLQNALNSKANLTSENFHFPYYKESTNEFTDSKLYYEGGNQSRLYHDFENAFGNTVPNLILDGATGQYQIGQKDNVDWPNPQTGINFNVNDNTFAITVGFAFNPKLNYFYDTMYISGGSTGAGYVNLNDWGVSLLHQQGSATVYGAFGATLDGANGNANIYGFGITLSAQNNVGIYANSLNIMNPNMMANGVKTQTDRYIRMLDENGVEYWIPMYQ